MHRRGRRRPRSPRAGYARSWRVPQRLRERVSEAPGVLEAVVEGYRRHANDVGETPVAYHAARGQSVEYAASVRCTARNAQRKLAAAPAAIRRRDDADRRAQRPQQPFEVVGERDGLPAQPLQAGVGEDLQRGDERCRREDRRITDLPRGCPACGVELRLHLEPRLRLVPPPPGEARPGKRAGAAMIAARQCLDVALMDETAADRPGASIEVLVAAPDGE